MEMLATTNAGRRGIYLWSNQMLFGDPTDILPSEKPVYVAMPSVTTGTSSAGATAEAQEDSEDSESLVSTSTDFDAAEGDDSASDHAEDQPSTSAAAEQPAYEETDATGAPKPLVPELVTLSMLPRMQWENLMYLDAIKARNKPIQPPKKPEAAPFFLPTVATLARNPVFDTTAAASASGQDADANNLAGDEQGAEAPSGKKQGKRSKVVKTQGAAPPVSTFLRLLRAGADSGDYTSFVAHLREQPPATIDLQLRAMQVSTAPQVWAGVRSRVMP